MTTLVLRLLLLEIAAITACGGTPDTPPPDVAGTWTAPVSQNTDPARQGLEEQEDGFVLVLGPASGEPVPAADEPEHLEIWEHSGSASLTVALFRGTGETDSFGEPVVARLAAAKYAGTWTSRFSEDPQSQNPDLGEVVAERLPCESVEKLDPEAPAAICGQDGITSSWSVRCTPTEGNPSLPCKLGDFGSDVVTFRRR